MAAGQPEIFESPYISIHWEDELLVCQYARNLHLSLEVAKQCVEGRIFFSKGKNCLLLVDMTGIKSTTREARHYMATIGTTQVIAAALITGSTLNRALANLFLTVNKPQVPTRLFTNPEKAKQWLRQFKPE